MFSFDVSIAYLCSRDTVTWFDKHVSGLLGFDSNVNQKSERDRVYLVWREQPDERVDLDSLLCEQCAFCVLLEVIIVLQVVKEVHCVVVVVDTVLLRNALLQVALQFVL